MSDPIASCCLQCFPPSLPQELAARSAASDATAAAAAAALQLRAERAAAAALAAEEEAALSASEAAASAMATATESLRRAVKSVAARAASATGAAFKAAAAAEKARSETVRQQRLAAEAAAATRRWEEAAAQAEKRAGRMMAERRVLRRAARQLTVQLSRARAELVLLARAAPSADPSAAAAGGVGLDPAATTAAKREERLAAVEELLAAARLGRTRTAAAVEQVMAVAEDAVEAAGAGTAARAGTAGASSAARSWGRERAGGAMDAFLQALRGSGAASPTATEPDAEEPPVDTVAAKEPPSVTRSTELGGVEGASGAEDSAVGPVDVLGRVGDEVVIQDVTGVGDTDKHVVTDESAAIVTAAAAKEPEGAGGDTGIGDMILAGESAVPAIPEEEAPPEVEAAGCFCWPGTLSTSRPGSSKPVSSRPGSSRPSQSRPASSRPGLSPQPAPVSSTVLVSEMGEKEAAVEAAPAGCSMSQGVDSSSRQAPAPQNTASVGEGPSDLANVQTLARGAGMRSGRDQMLSGGDRGSEPDSHASEIADKSQELVGAVDAGGAGCVSVQEDNLAAAANNRHIEQSMSEDTTERDTTAARFTQLPHLQVLAACQESSLGPAAVADPAIGQLQSTNAEKTSTAGIQDTLKPVALITALDGNVAAGAAEAKDSTSSVRELIEEVGSDKESSFSSYASSTAGAAVADVTNVAHCDVDAEIDCGGGLWRKAQASDGGVYYFHTGTSVTQWHRPTDYDSEADTAASHADSIAELADEAETKKAPEYIASASGEEGKCTAELQSLPVREWKIQMAEDSVLLPAAADSIVRVPHPPDRGDDHTVSQGLVSSSGHETVDSSESSTTQKAQACSPQQPSELQLVPKPPLSQRPVSARPGPAAAVIAK